MGQPIRTPRSPQTSDEDMPQLKKPACSFTNAFNEELDKNVKNRMKVNKAAGSNFDKIVQDELQVILRGFIGTYT